MILLMERSTCSLIKFKLYLIVFVHCPLSIVDSIWVHFSVSNNRVRGLSLDLIKRRLDRGVYKRLDRFQEDVFTCLERARRLSRSDSQPFEDSVELQAFFLRTRDEVTRSGDLLHSPALNYTLLDLSAQVAELKRVKQQQELTLPNEEESCDGNDTKVCNTLCRKNHAGETYCHLFGISVSLRILKRMPIQRGVIAIMVVR